jgi:uncharacterized protein DUF6600/FecR-like protein
MNPVRVVGRSLLALLFAFVLTAQATSQSPEQNPQPPGPYEPTAAPPDSTDWVQDVPAHIAVVDGTATLDRDGRSEKAEENTVLLAGDRLRTERGRVEVLFADGSALDLDQNTRIDLLSDSLVRLLSGRIRLTIARSTSSIDYRIDAPPGTVAINAAGDYRIALADTQSGEVELDVAVFRGSAELRNTHGLTLVRPGTHAAVTAGTAPSLPLSVNSAAWDEFDRWVEDQRDARSGGPSATYLPEEVRSYSGAFDSYGSWDYLPTYGQVWYPNVAFGWKPYHHGRWSFAGRFGWYWGSSDRFWGWPTHHYGRWGYASNRWFWMPGYRWSPAWVSWAYAPGYVSWCPLGFYNRPIVGFNTSFVIYPAYVWTVVPRHAFSGPVPVQHYAVPPQAIPASTWSRFVVRPAAPVAPTTLVARAQPIRAPTRGYAVPRSGSAGPAFDSFTGLQPMPSRAPSRVAPPATATTTAASAPQSSVRPNLASQNPLPAPQRAVPRASAAPSVASGSAARSAATLPRNYSPEPRTATALPRNYSSEVRNYNPEPRGASSEPRTYVPDRTVTPDRGVRSRVPGSARPATQQSAPEPDRAQPAAQPWTPRNYSPEAGGHVERGLSRMPRTYSPDPGPANPPGSPGGGFLRSRVPDSPGQAPSPGSFAAPRGEPRSAPPTADSPRAAPSRATPPPDTGRGSGSGAQAQPSRRGRG